jgi:hypothetical protein
MYQFAQEQLSLSQRLRLAFAKFSLADKIEEENYHICTRATKFQPAPMSCLRQVFFAG